jgi:predicted dehydrogenase
MITAAVVGTGPWAENHIRAYQRCREVRLVGLCEPKDAAARLDELAQRYGIAATSLDLRELLARTKPDMLDIACNPHFRLEGVRAALGSSVRLVNLEKPMALTPADGYEIERLCREHGLLLTVNHQKKFLPGWRDVKEAIASGTIGPIEFMRATCLGNLLEQGTHLVDMALYYNSYCPLRWAMGQVDELEGLDKPGAGAPDAAVATLCFDDEVRAYMEFGSVGHPVPGAQNKWMHFAVEVYGAKGHAKVALNTSWEVTTYADGRTVGGETSWDRDFVQALADHLDAAARYAQNPGMGHLSELGRSMMSFEAVMGIYASACGGGRVTLPQRFPDDLCDRLAAMRK